MKIIIRNNAQLPNKYLRFIKWKLYQLSEKFHQLLYVNVFLNTEGNSPKTYLINMRLGIPGNDIILSHKSEDLGQLFRKFTNAMYRALAKSKDQKLNG
ncbi:MAG: hypothetical protein AAFV95_07455 [Bacteroidota bacterium]